MQDLATIKSTVDLLVNCGGMDAEKVLSFLKMYRNDKQTELNASIKEKDVEMVAMLQTEMRELDDVIGAVLLAAISL